MNSLKKTLRSPKLPGLLALALVTLTTVLWTFWGVAEMYYEGWWGSWANRLPYLIPGGACLLLALLALTWPRPGGWLLIVIGGAFTAWILAPRITRGGLSLGDLLSWIPVTAFLVLTGGLFLLDGRYRRRQTEERRPLRPRLLRHWRYIVLVGAVVLTVIGVSAANLPRVLARQDDGDRGARLIQGNGVALIWAPQGPGWNWRQPWGGYPSWDSLALYGAPPIGLEDKPGRDDRHATPADMAASGLCRHLAEDGLTLTAEPQNLWRMPTSDELVRSLLLHGQNAGCAWDGQLRLADCQLAPDKETPLWAPDQPPIYYWSGEEYDEIEAYYVSFNGYVNRQPKNWGNPRHGYRCVREP